MSKSYDRAPVIIGVGQITQRTKVISESLEPLALMEAALRAAEKDAGASILPHVDSLHVIQEFSWPYANAPLQLSQRLGMDPAHRIYGQIGGETPVHAIHEAALRISSGECELAAVVGGEAQYAVSAAEKGGVPLPWSPRDPDAVLVRGVDYLHPMAIALGVATPATVYPFYENAVQRHWGQTPCEGRTEAGRLWAACSGVAARNPYAWKQEAWDPDAVVTATASNRLVAWPYTVRMVANPLVNQGAALLVTSRVSALRWGISEEHLVYVGCGAAAQEPADYLHRDSYTHVVAQEAVFETILQQLGDGGGFDVVELYSCFPVVPKMARRMLALADDAPVTCTGGLSFFGAPLNNYMSHAAATMVGALRGRESALGLLYGQGGYLTKHHAIVLSSAPSATHLLTDNYSVQAVADARRGAVPSIDMNYTGSAVVETHTVLYQRDGSVQHGVVIARTPGGTRLLARVDAADAGGIAALTNLDRSPIGRSGQVQRDLQGMPIWRFA